MAAALSVLAYVAGLAAFWGQRPGALQLAKEVSGSREPEGG